jgi:glutathione S-transferase
MSKITLTYFDAPAARGEECRLALHLAGVAFTDERLNPEQWNAKKASTPYGALPVFTVEGHEPIAETNAILRLIGSEHGLHPTEPFEAARQEAVMGAVEDLRGRLSPMLRIKDPDEKKRAREELANGYLQQWAGNIEKQIKGTFVGGEKLNVADIKLFVITGPVLRGALDHIPPSSLSGFPKLLALAAAVKADPRVQDWYSRR